MKKIIYLLTICLLFSCTSFTHDVKERDSIKDKKQTEILNEENKNNEKEKDDIDSNLKIRTNKDGSIKGVVIESNKKHKK